MRRGQICESTARRADRFLPVLVPVVGLPRDEQERSRGDQGEKMLVPGGRTRAPNQGGRGVTQLIIFDHSSLRNATSVIKCFDKIHNCF